MAGGYREQSSVIAGFAFILAAVAILGTQYLGWEWGSDQVVPTIVGVVVTVLAIVLVVRGYGESHLALSGMSTDST